MWKYRSPHGASAGEVSGSNPAARARRYIASTSSTQNTTRPQTALPGEPTVSSLKVEVAGANPEAGERRLRSSVEKMEAERLVKGHGVKHVDGQHRYGADALDRQSLRFHTGQPYRRLQGKAPPSWPTTAPGTGRSSPAPRATCSTNPQRKVVQYPPSAW